MMEDSLYHPHIAGRLFFGDANNLFDNFNWTGLLFVVGKLGVVGQVDYISPVLGKTDHFSRKEDIKGERDDDGRCCCC